jgi:hypothetical protein
MLTPSPKMSPSSMMVFADIDAHAKFDPASRRHGGIAGDHFALHLDGTAHGVNHAGEFNEKDRPCAIVVALRPTEDVGETRVPVLPDGAATTQSWPKPVSSRCRP